MIRTKGELTKSGFTKRIVPTNTELESSKRSWRIAAASKTSPDAASIVADRGRPRMSVESGAKSTSYWPTPNRRVSAGSVLQRQQATIVPSAAICAQALTRPLLWFSSFEKRLVTLALLARNCTAVSPSSFLRRNLPSSPEPPSAMLARMSLLRTQGLFRSSSLQTGPATAAAAPNIKAAASAAVVTVTELTLRMVFLPLLVLCSQQEAIPV